MIVRRWFRVLVPCSLLLCSTVVARQPGKPLSIDEDHLQPGLVATYRSLVDPAATLTRIDAKPAFSLGLSSPHPRLPPGPFEVVWTGILSVRDDAPLTFDARVCGRVTVEVDGVTVLRGQGSRPTDRLVGHQTLQREAGAYRLRIVYQSLPHVPAQLQLGWQAPAFPHQPLPAWQLKHLATQLPPAFAQEARSRRGRLLVGQFGCARCHVSAFPGIKEPPPGPSLAEVRTRVRPDWLLAWLAEPAQVRPGAHMPAVFSAGRQGLTERWLLVEHVLGVPPTAHAQASPVHGDHRRGRNDFIHLGCAACHFLPELPAGEQANLDRWPLSRLADRWRPDSLARFLRDPRSRYPDGRMPHLALSSDTAQNIAAYLWLWSKPTPVPLGEKPPSPAAVQAVLHRLGVATRSDAARALLQARGCVQCHPGLAPARAVDIPLSGKKNVRGGCLGGKTLPHYMMDQATKGDLAAYLAVAAREKYPSPFTERQRLLERSGCVRCHRRDTDRPPAIEQAGSTLGGSLLETVPYQRTPRLTQAHQKYRLSYLLHVVRDGSSGLKGPRYSYQMPAFGTDAAPLVQALAEADGDWPVARGPGSKQSADPTLGSLVGPKLTGFQGYACVACHVWAGRYLADPDPGAIGPDLTRVADRIRRDWFDRFLEDPSRFHPGTPMPAIFPRGSHTTIASILDGDPGRQKEAFWRYFALGKSAPSPQLPPPLPITAPLKGEPALVAQVPIRLPDRTVVESISVLDSQHNLLIYDLAGPGVRAIYTGAEILRHAQGRERWYAASGQPLSDRVLTRPVLRLTGDRKAVALSSAVFHGYDRLADGVRLRWQACFGPVRLEAVETLRLVQQPKGGRLLRQLQLRGVPAGQAVEWCTQPPARIAVHINAIHGAAKLHRTGANITLLLTPAAASREVSASISHELPPAQTPPRRQWTVRVEPDRPEGALTQPGYRVIAYPRPKTVAGDDRLMPAALAVHPQTGKVFVASWKTGELFVLDDPTDDGKAARFRNYAHGLFQDALAMHAENDGLYVLHRRNLTRVVDTTGAGVADRFERVLALPHGIADTYDYAYGLVRDRTGAFILSFAPYANRQMPGSGGALSWKPGHKPKEIAFGFRNPLGWCTGPGGEVFFTDNQGEWVATNKLCHLEEGRYYGFPNPAQPQHVSRPRGSTAIWIPYGWAHSINGVAYDNTGGTFGPFHGQFFLAELMFGGAIIRAQVEKVNGQYQGACFPFWGRGLLGPLTLAFDPRGRLYVGSLTEPGWMAQPDRGGLFRIDFTGQTPFEMQAVHVQPHGFRIDFTRPVSVESARQLSSYRLEHYRYEYTGAYGSPELDRTAVAVERIEVSADGRSVELTTSPLVKGRVYLLRLPGLRSARGEALVHSEAAYTLNEIPQGKNLERGQRREPTRGGP